MKCHFVYAVPTDGVINRLRRVAYLELQRLGLPLCWFGNRYNPDMSYWLRCSPYENTRQIFHYMSSRIPTVLYSLDENVRCKFTPDDVFLGHPFFPYKPGGRGVTELSINQSPRPRIFALICPLHCDTTVRTEHINKAYLDAVDKLLPYVDILFAIMGQYWRDRWPSSPFSHWIDKMVRLDMAVDTRFFPRVKKRFNPPGKRGYLYIGKNDPMKGTDFLGTLFDKLHAYPRGWIGDGPGIPATRKISNFRPLTPEFMEIIAEQYDFLVSASVADPNPTTILEGMAWGFPVICTPQSGYYETSYRKNIYRDDFDRSLDVLLYLQSVNEEVLQKMADDARKVVESEYTWDRFVGTICKELSIK